MAKPLDNSFRTSKTSLRFKAGKLLPSYGVRSQKRLGDETPRRDGLRDRHLQIIPPFRLLMGSRINQIVKRGTGTGGTCILKQTLDLTEQRPSGSASLQKHKTTRPLCQPISPRPRHPRGPRLAAHPQWRDGTCSCVRSRGAHAARRRRTLECSLRTCARRPEYCGV